MGRFGCFGLFFFTFSPSPGGGKPSRELGGGLHVRETSYICSGMATYKVYDLAAAGSYLVAEARVSGSDYVLGNFSALLRAVGDLYLPDPVPDSFFDSLLRAVYSSLHSSLGLDSLGSKSLPFSGPSYPSPSDPSLSSYFGFVISSFPSRSRSYQEPEGGERVARYHVVRVSVESMVASFLLVDQPQEGDGIISQIYFPLRSRCSDSLKLYE